MPWRSSSSFAGRRLRSRYAFALHVEMLEARLVMAGVPAFSSLPGANQTIYLDFDGHTVQGTSWNSYYNQTTLVAKPFDIDNNPNAFSATELQRIEEAWKRVSEDFAPFNVNVTTVDPGVEALRKTSSSDVQYGIRVIITTESTMVTNAASRSGAGGIAYINSFTWNTDTPAWVFTNGGKSIAEAASHEVGHSLGLAHDGTASAGYYQGHGSGETGWAPIMGVGYYQNVTQWDNGSYAGSNNTGTSANYGRGADDLAVILAYNGFGYRNDDHGNANNAATPLSVSGTSVSGSGLIERSTDADVFSFNTGGGNVTLNINPFAVGPNLDIRADLYNSAGTLVATSNSTATLSASFSQSLAAGTYYVRIDGTGSGNYSDYGSIGRYTISGTVPSAGTAAAQLTVADITVDESVGTAYFRVVLSGAITAPVTVNYATANNSAVGGSDFTAKSGMLTFTPGGATSQQVAVAITNDSAVEAVERFYFNLSGASGATIARAQAVATINDNDVASPGALSINSVAMAEGNASAGKVFTFTVQLAKAVTQQVTVKYATADGTAKVANGDYAATAGTLTFAPGQISKTVSVVVYGNTLRELDETFYVRLSNATGANITTAEGVGTIFNDDAGALTSAAPLAIVDDLWYFEEDADHQQHDHHDHHDQQQQTVDGDSQAAREWSLGIGSADWTTAQLGANPRSTSGNLLTAPVKFGAVEVAPAAPPSWALESHFFESLSANIVPQPNAWSSRPTSTDAHCDSVDELMAAIDDWRSTELEVL